MSLGANIKRLRKTAGLTQEDIAKKIGVSKQTVQKYENGIITNIPSDKIEIMATMLKTTPSILMGWEDIPTNISNILPLPKMKKVPLLGTIACGEPILATENIDALVNADIDLDVDFALKCKGDSMINARIFDGDIVYIRQQSDVDDGDIAAVLIADEATLKRVYKYPNKLVLRPENPLYDDMVYQGSELDQIRIIGKAIAFLSAVRSK